MADIKLIALDLDGTLLTTDKRLTDRTKATLKLRVIVVSRSY